ncbi:hypothetical protein [Dissulfurimicrobium hydrothermale]|uniref:hypothetical protein n=1 Tax=Dissulfurimicrobium hydrothermale TaxID=1750598 RepID=UPI001EDB5BDB|nr:hypothetical protein [Dissulfurimicrobium hydrothermale]UKL12997.1 hypothetical protein LGS26_05735 [Dissulfurimicrobium hydrothermale]
MAQALFIQIISPLSGSVVTSGEILAQAQVTLDCGLPACAGGRFNPERFKVAAALFRDDVRISEATMTYKKDIGISECRFELMGVGDYTLQVEAYDPETGLAGRNAVKFHAKGPLSPSLP